MKIRDFLLERYFGKYEFTAPYLMSSSDCESFSIRELLSYEADGLEKFENVHLGYTESEGNPNLRAEICKLYSSIESQDVLCFVGAEEAIFILMNTLLEASDHVIVQYPAYQSLFEIAESIGCEVSKWNAVEENEVWDFKISDLESMIKPSTKLLIINQPHNPTGALFSESKFLKVIELARKHDLYLFSDEVYRFLEYNSRDRLQAACDLYFKSFSLGVMSKAFGLAGLRIGWIATKQKNILEKMKAFKDYTSICASAPSEFLAEFALTQKEKILERNLEIISKNLSLLQAFFARYETFFSWNKPKAGSIGFVKLLIDIDVQDFCKEVVESCGVLLLPSTLYEFGNSHFRIGFGRKNFAQSLEVFEECIKKKYLKK